ncbi:MAG: 50S ribosomal protein L11 methyltransferase [Myxococcales bacterium]|nr:50S ribosomal protein L11 methyltransferase [Myxococcales bacterium]
MTDRFRKALTLFDDYREMMADRVRLDAYARAIEATVREGDVVVDLGAGLGILSLLAARAGARKVYAIEKGDAARLAARVVEQNGLAGRIEVIEATSRDVELDAPADVLVSETLGSFGIEENTLAFTIDARDRLLAPGGRMVPCAIECFLAPVELPEEHEAASFWADVRGFDFSAARDEMLSRMRVANVAPERLVARPQRSARFDLATTTEPGLAVRHLFPIERPGVIHGLAGWFAVELADGVSIDTAPGSAPTHWRQAYFPYREAVRVVAGDLLEVKLRLAPRDARSDDTAVAYEFRCTQRDA